MGVSTTLGFDIQRLLRPHCRDYHFGELVEYGMPIGVYILTPGVRLAPWLRQEIREVVERDGMPMRTKTSFFSQREPTEGVMMGTKLNPGKHDCFNNALPDEPMFVLLARDPDFARLIETWAKRREYDILCGERPESDRALLIEARNLANDGAHWRKENMGKWRK